MLNTCRRWSGDKIVTVVVVTAWLLVWIVPGIIHSMEERKAKLNDEATFLKDKPRLEETIMRVYEAVRDGNTSAFEEVVNVDSFLNGIKKEYPDLTKQDILKAIEGKEVFDPNTPYGIRLLRWSLVDAESEKTFYKFVKETNGRYLNPYSRYSSKRYLVELTFQAYGYKHGNLRFCLEEKDGRFYISHDWGIGRGSILKYQSKLAILNRPQTWDEAEMNAAGTLKWKFGQFTWDTSERKQMGVVPIEVEAIGRNLKGVTFVAQIVEVSTGQVIDTVNISASSEKVGMFIVEKNISVMGSTGQLDTKLIQLLCDGYLVIGRIVPVSATYEGSGWQHIDFSESLGGIKYL